MFILEEKLRLKLVRNGKPLFNSLIICKTLKKTVIFSNLFYLKIKKNMSYEQYKHGSMKLIYEKSLYIVNPLVALQKSSIYFFKKEKPSKLLEQSKEHLNNNNIQFFMSREECVQIKS